MGGLVGSAPSVRQQSTVTPQQQALLSYLGGQVSGQYPGTTLNFGQVQPNLTGQYAAPLSQLQTQSLSGIENLVNTYSGAPLSSVSSVTSPLNTAIGGAQQAATANPVSMINSQNAFNQGVVQPLTEDFTQYVIPRISGQYGQSAGGAFSSDQQDARQTAGQTLARTLAQQGSLFDLQAQQANQAAQATNAQLQAAARSQIPGLVAAPLGIDTAQEQLLQSGLGAGGVPQQTQQQQISGQFADYQDILNQIAQQLQDALGVGTAQTQQSVVSPGQTGLIPALIAAFGGGFGQGYGRTLGS